MVMAGLVRSVATRLVFKVISTVVVPAAVVLSTLLEIDLKLVPLTS
jgi:hypothetical protein